MDSPRLKFANHTETLIGSWGSVPHPMTAEVVSGLGYDFVGIDIEHSPASFETLAGMLRAVDAGEAETLVRVADDDPTTLGRTLDLGPDAILVPMVHTPEQAERVVDATRYPPAGSRGVGPGRASDYGRSLPEYVEVDGETFATHVQLETARAVENAAEIAAVEGVDGIFVGPMDLSLALGAYGEWDSEEFTEAVERALEAARGADVAIGTFATSAPEREERLAWGVDYLVAGVDLLHLTAGATEALEHSRSVLADQPRGENERE